MAPVTAQRCWWCSSVEEPYFERIEVQKSSAPATECGESSIFYASWFAWWRRGEIRETRVLNYTLSVCILNYIRSPGVLHCIYILF